MFPEHASYLEKAAFFSEKVTIYPVSCEVLANGRSDIEWLEAVLAGGARIVQLRDKHSDDLTLYRKALVFREKTREAGALFIVNNRVDIALLTKADGVHLGNNDLPAQEVRKLASQKSRGLLLQYRAAVYYCNKEEPGAVPGPGCHKHLCPALRPAVYGYGRCETRACPGACNKGSTAYCRGYGLDPGKGYCRGNPALDRCN